MSDERWRLFVAVPIGEELRGALRDAVAGWGTDEQVEGLRWTDPDGWHVTLAFLGETDPAAVPELAERLAAVAARHEPTKLRTGGLDAFPTRARARVAWYGVEDVDGRIAALSADVSAALSLGATQTLRPHLTLARAQGDHVDLRSWLGSASAPAGNLVADRIELMRSHVGAGPARYETVATINLGVPDGV